MEIKKELLAPCGLYCGVCAIMMAHRDNNQKLKEKLAPLYGVTPEGIRCQGCLSSDVFAYCTKCPIKACTREKDMRGVTSAMSFLAHTWRTFPWLSARRLFCGLFRIGESLEPKNGFKMKRPDIFARNAGTRFSGAR